MNARKYCAFTVERHFVGVPIENVQEILPQCEMTPVPMAHPSVSGLFNLRGQVVTALDLRTLMDLPPRPEGEAATIVLANEESVFSLVVDEIRDIVEAEETTFEPPPETLKGSARRLIRGVHKLEGQLMLVLSPDEVYAAASTSQSSS